jgi:hypothetical protein
MDVPIDASPKFRERCLRIKAAMEKHGSFNSYYLHNAACRYHLTNNEAVGTLEFRFEGTVLTDSNDQETIGTDLQVELIQETCDWLKQPIVEWFHETVSQTVKAEFNLYIKAGDLEKAKQRMAQLQAEADKSGGFMGMGL